MPTTTFCDIKFTENVENYTYENKPRNFDKGQVVSLPRHTASKFVTKWEMAEWSEGPYEVRDDEYDEVLCRVRNESKEVEKCEVEKSDGEVCGREKPCSYHSDDE